MFEAIGTFLASILSGGATGIISAAVQRYSDYKNKELDLQSSREKMAHEVEMKKADAAIMAQEWASRTQVAQIEGASEVDAEDAKAFAVGLAAEPKLYSEHVAPNVAQAWLLVLLDFIRGLVRPALTLYLSVLTTLIYFHIEKLSSITLTEKQAFDLMNLIVSTILYLTTTCTLHWFSTRNKQKAPTIS